MPQGPKSSLLMEKSRSIPTWYTINDVSWLLVVGLLDENRGLSQLHAHGPWFVCPTHVSIITLFNTRGVAFLVPRILASCREFYCSYVGPSL